MTALSDAFLARLAAGFSKHRDPERAVGMAAYMRDQFAFFGIQQPERGEILRDVESGLDEPNERDVRAVVLGCWKRPEREFQYAATLYARRHAPVVSRGFIDVSERLITTKSWWATVDEIASHLVGDLVLRFPELRRCMDDWSRSPNIWLARTAIIHQLRYRSKTDVARLFDYCARRAPETEFFIRKAIGWALREYSKTDARAVERFLDENDARLSGLSKREAMTWLNATRRKAKAKRR